MLARYILLIFLLQQQRCANAAKCEGTLNLNLALQVCQRFFNETACSHDDTTFCLWDSDNGCDLKPSSSCSLLADNMYDCSSVYGCYWAEVPVWMWLAINIPVWLGIAGFCLICYHRHVGPTTIVFYDRSDSMTAYEDSSQFTEEQLEAVSDMFRSALNDSCSNDITESENSSSNASIVLEMEGVGPKSEEEV